MHTPKCFDEIDAILMPAGTLQLPWQDYNRAVILINGKELLDYIAKAETALFAKYGLNSEDAGGYHYFSPLELYDNVNNSKNSEIHGAYILTCTCDDFACSSVRNDIITTQNSVIWTNFRSIRETWILSCSFEFTKQNYFNFLEKIKSFPC